MTRGRTVGALVCAVVGAGLLVSIAPARRSSDPALIRVNASIGAVALHMTRAAVEARYGAPASSFEIVASDGVGALARYRSHRGLLLVTYDATARVAAVETDSRYYRTVGGVGPGTAATGARRLRGFQPDPCSGGYWNGSPDADGTDLVTVFTVSGDRIASVQITQAALLTSCLAAIGELAPEVGAGGFTVTASVDPPGSGYLRSAPPGIDCPVDCGELFPVGATVTIVPHASGGFLFERWSGDCEFLDPCVVRADGPRHVVAHFRQPPPPPPPPPPEDEPTPPGEPSPGEEGAVGE